MYNSKKKVLFFITNFFFLELPKHEKLKNLKLINNCNIRESSLDDSGVVDDHECDADENNVVQVSK